MMKRTIPIKALGIEGKINLLQSNLLDHSINVSFNHSLFGFTLIF